MPAARRSTVAQFHQGGAQFKSLTDSIDTATPSGRSFFHVMASLAEMEREFIVERTRAGLEAARQLGRNGAERRWRGACVRRPACCRSWRGGARPDVARNLGVSVPVPR